MQRIELTGDSRRLDVLLAEGSGYSDLKAVYAEYFPEAAFEETLAEDGFTLSISGTEYSDGSWTFTRDGDALTASFGSEDLGGIGMTLYVVQAVGSALGMDPVLTSAYVNGLSALGLESDNFVYAEEGDTATVRINIAGSWDMKELDEMVIGEATLAYGPLGEESTSVTGSIGRMMIVANGSAEDVTILLGEYAGLDELAWQSIVNAVGLLQPRGWEAFTADYAQLQDAEGDGYSVRLDVGLDEVRQIIDDPNEDYSYAIIHFGA